MRVCCSVSISLSAEKTHTIAVRVTSKAKFGGFNLIRELKDAESFQKHQIVCLSFFLPYTQNINIAFRFFLSNDFDQL